MSPDIRLPRTFKRFSGLFAQLMTQGRITAGQAGGKTLLQVNNYAIHGLVHSEFKYVKLNTESKGNFVENFAEYTKKQKESLNAYVIDLSST